MVLGQCDHSLLERAETEAAAALANPSQPPRVHEMAPGAAAPSFPRLDKLIQIVDLDGHVVARSANLGSARLPTPPGLIARLRQGEPVLETLPDFGDEPLRLLSVPLQLGTGASVIQVGGPLADVHVPRRGARRPFPPLPLA